MVDIACERTFTPKEELEALTLYGTSKEVMDETIAKTLRRASARGQTVANGGVFLFESEEAKRKRYSEEL